MSGPRAPVSLALAWCGWQVEPMDTLLDATHDLSASATQAEVRTLRQELALTAALPEMVATLSEQVRRLAAKLEELTPDGETPENPLLDAVNVLAKRVVGVERSQAVTDEKVDHAVYQVSGQTLVHSYGWPRPGPQAVG